MLQVHSGLVTVLGELAECPTHFVTYKTSFASNAHKSRMKLDLKCGRSII